VNGDVIDLSNVLGELNGYQTGENPFTAGYMRLSWDQTPGIRRGCRSMPRMGRAGKCVAFRQSGSRKLHLCEFQPSDPLTVWASIMSIGGLSSTINGSASNDTIQGTDGNDTIYAGYGNDSVIAGPGDNSVYGDLGNDTIVAGDGNNSLYGGGGDDSLIAGNGAITWMAGTATTQSSRYREQHLHRRHWRRQSGRGGWRRFLRRRSWQ